MTKAVKKNHPRRKARGKGSDKGITLGEEPLLALLHAGLRPVLEELVVPPDGAKAIVDGDKPPVGGTSVDLFGESEEDFHLFLRVNLHEEKSPRKRGNDHLVITTDRVTGTCRVSVTFR